MRWAAAVPDHFRFSVKFPKAATHEARLVGCEGIIERFLAETSALGDKRGPVLIQLPPSLAFDTALAGQFFTALRDRFSGSVACEPRHATWFGREAEAVLTGHAIARVAADPPRVPAGDNPGGVQSMSYWRMHGSPQMYRTPYADRIAPLANALMKATGEVWCIFDNTMSGAATSDALATKTFVAEGQHK